jgi:hypothetical protein
VTVLRKRLPASALDASNVPVSRAARAIRLSRQEGSTGSIGSLGLARPGAVSSSRSTAGAPVSPVLSMAFSDARHYPSDARFYNREGFLGREGRRYLRARKRILHNDPLFVPQ